MKPPKLHRILPPLVMSTAVIAPGASAAAIILHAKSEPTTSLASGVTISSAPAAKTGSMATTATATRKAVASGTARKKAAVATPAVIVPTATAAPQPTATLKSSALQAQSSSSSNVVSGATNSSH